jgi:gamma-glutamyltranspeptidase/glutathione hydrolase
MNGYVLENQDFNGDIAAIEIQGRTPVTAADPRDRGVGFLIETDTTRNVKRGDR